MMLTACCWSFTISGNDTLSAATETAWMTPVSCTGKNPFGTMTNSSAVSASVASEADQHQRLMPEDDVERAAITLDDPIERTLGPPIEPATVVIRRVREQPRRHHRRQRERHRCRNQDRHRERDGEFAEQTPDDVAHEQQRNEHGDQRHRQRDDREADLFRAMQGGLDRRFPLLDEPCDVLDHHDRIVHDEAGRDGEGHQRQVVQAVAEEVHHGERADESTAEPRRSE